jgi:hypothetical protein
MAVGLLLTSFVAFRSLPILLTHKTVMIAYMKHAPYLELTDIPSSEAIPCNLFTPLGYFGKPWLSANSQLTSILIRL